MLHKKFQFLRLYCLNSHKNQNVYNDLAFWACKKNLKKLNLKNVFILLHNSVQAVFNN